MNDRKRDDFDGSLVVETDTMVLFWQPPAVFGQWTLSPFVLDGTDYSCAEQFMMAEKARLFGDSETCAKILASTSPREQKALGRQVRGFDSAVWDRSCLDIVVRGNRAKFSQNPEMREALLATKDKLLVEASPLDTLWGVGLRADDPLIHDREMWRGENLLGKALTCVRSDLRACSPALRYTARLLTLPPTSLGGWRPLDRDGRVLWLREVSNRYFRDEAYRAVSKTPGREVVLDGSIVDGLLGFYCAIGECVNGPGGFFGSIFLGFDDCLFSGFGLEYPYTIVWTQSEASKLALGSQAFLEYLETECVGNPLFEEDEDGRAWLAQSREEALRGERTMFDEIVRAVQSVTSRGRGEARLVLA